MIAAPGLESRKGRMRGGDQSAARSDSSKKPKLNQPLCRARTQPPPPN